MNRTKTKISGMIPHGFKAEKCKVSLRMAMSRMKLLRNKREVQVRQMRRDVAQLLQSGQDQTARIRVEHVIREEKTMAAYELLELYCELIVARLPIIDSQKTCPIDLQEAVSSLIFASPRCADVQELMDVRKQFLTKYGKEFTTAALELRPDCGVSHMIIEKLSAKAPDTETKIKTLKSIAEEHGIEWDSKALLDELQKSKNDLLMGHSASQVTMGHPATNSVNTSTQTKPTQFLSASQVATGYSTTNSSADIDRTSSEPKLTQFRSESEVKMDHPDFSSSTGNGPTSFEQPKTEDTTEVHVANTPDDQVPRHGGFVSSTGSIIYPPPPPPPFMRYEDSAPSGTQPELTSPGDTLKHEKTKHKYKDAKEAARAAAESAERAQMAAKAAAEMARHENNARGKARAEEDTYSVPDVGFIEDAPEQSVTETLKTHNNQVLQDFQTDEEEEERTTPVTGPDREHEQVNWDKHETSSIAVFDQGDSDIDEYSTNLLDTFSQPKKEEYWREEIDSKRHDRNDNVFFEDSTRDFSPPKFASSSAPTFDSDGFSSDNESEDDIKANKSQPTYIYSDRREEKEVLSSGLKNAGASSDYDSDEGALGLNFGKLTGGLKNKGYRQPPYVKKRIDATPSVESLHYDDVYVSSRTKKQPFSDVHDAESSSVVSVETENGQRGRRKSASRFDTDYFNTQDEMEAENRQVTGRPANKNITQHSRGTRDTSTSKIKKEDHFGENRDTEMSDEETTNESVVAEKPEFDEDQMKSSVPPSTSVRSRRPPDYESLAAHFRSLRTDKP